MKGAIEMGLIVSVSGIRGLVAADLDIHLASKVGMIFGRLRKDDSLPIVVAGDSRISSPALRSATIAGLLAVGADVIDLGLAATPTACFMIRKLGAAGGVVVTASHNPIEWNGIKLFGPEGFGLSVEQAEQFKHVLADPPPQHAGATQCGRLMQRYESHQPHVKAIVDRCDRRLVDQLRSGGTTVVLDSVNGAGAVAGKAILEELGCRVCAINAEPTGRFAHPPEPVPENLGQICQAVIESGAQVGFAQDPDADRLVIVDEAGRCIGEEYTLALACLYVLSVSPGPVATNLSTSRMIDDIAERFGQKVIRTPVGEANVASQVLANNCPIGGEGNGGVILPDVVPARDSLSGMAMILQLLAASGKTISQLVDELPRYRMVKTKVKCSHEHATEVCNRLAEMYADQKIDTADGLRIDFPNDRAWVHIRASNTEPIVRIIAEADKQTKADELIDRMVTLATQYSR